jgi:ERF superfamily
MVTSDAIDRLATALAVAQGEMDGAKKATVNPFFNHKYADLASVKDAIREPFAKAGLSVVQFPQTTFSGDPTAFEWTAKRSGEVRHGVRVFCTVAVVTRLMHSSGQWMEDSVSAMLPNGDPQAVGSAITYLRRYALQSIAGIAAEDDDAEATTRGANAAAAVVAAPVVVPTPAVAVAVPPPVAAPAARAPIQHPTGYLEWFDGLYATAMLGTSALQDVWRVAPREFTAHLVSVSPDKWETLKAIAARMVTVPRSA